MARMDLLKANYSGRLGETTGVVSKGKSIVKSRIWSKRPPNVDQTGAVRAFECVNRLSGALARKCFDLIGIDNKNMLKHNAVAKYLKPMLANKMFQPENIITKIPLSERLYISSDLNEPTNETFKYFVYLYENAKFSDNEKLIFIVFNKNGIVHFINILDIQNMALNIPLSGVDRHELQFIAFISSVKNDRRYLSETILKEDEIMILSPPITFGTPELNGQIVRAFPEISSTFGNVPAHLEGTELVFEKDGYYTFYQNSSMSGGYGTVLFDIGTAIKTSVPATEESLTGSITKIGGNLLHRWSAFTKYFTAGQRLAYLYFEARTNISSLMFGTFVIRIRFEPLPL